MSETQTDSTGHLQFIEWFKGMQREAKRINVAKGFNEIDSRIESMADYLRNTPYADLMPHIRAARTAQKLMLIVSELGEALESLRKGDGPDSHIPEFKGSEAEMADAVIRLMNLATDDGARLAEAIVAKQNYNMHRPYAHGGKKF